MADNRTQQEVHPLRKNFKNSDADANHDHESGTMPLYPKEFRKKNRVKCFAYILVFVVFQTGIILLFALTIMKIRTPKFRVQYATFQRFEIGAAANPDFRLRMNAQVAVKNTNFETFKFKSTPIVFWWRSGG